MRAALREILETTTLANLRDRQLPTRVAELVEDPEAWVSLGRIRGATPSGGRKNAQPKVNNVLDALKAAVHLPPKVEPPAWLDGQDGPPPRELVACRNGLAVVWEYYWSGF